MDLYSKYQQAFVTKSYPLAYLDEDLFHANIEGILQRVNDTIHSIRIASKSIRCLEALRTIFSHSNRFQGIMAYSVREACMLVNEGFDDILVAYPVVNDEELAQALQLTQNGAKIVFMVDNRTHLEQLDKLAKQASTQAEVCFDLDLSVKFPAIYFGVYRSPLRSVRDVEELGEFAQELSHVQVVGLMGYEAQIAGVADRSPARNPLLNAVVRLLKRRSVKTIAKKRKEAVEVLQSQGHQLRLVNGGGTGSIESTREEPWVTEITVGSGFYSPLLFDHYDTFKHEPAVGFGIQITRIPESGVFTCHGGGYIASGAVGVDKQPLPYLPSDAKLIPDEGAGEVQTPVKSEAPLTIGDPIFFRHAKAGELCEHFDELLVVRDGKVISSWSTYRGLKHNFL